MSKQNCTERYIKWSWYLIKRWVKLEQMYVIVGEFPLLTRLTTITMVLFSQEECASVCCEH